MLRFWSLFLVILFASCFCGSSELWPGANIVGAGPPTTADSGGGGGGGGVI